MAGDGPDLSGDQPGCAAALAGLSARLAENQAFLSGWELLGSTTLKRVQAKMWQVVAPMVVLVLASLWFAFRRPTEILLGAGGVAAERLVPAGDRWRWPAGPGTC